MRELKFRVYTKKGMYVFGLCDLYWRGEDTGQYNFPEGLEVMQYTGLTDKNGKEIYEGDILNSEFGTIGVIEYGKTLGGYMAFYIVWSDGDITGFEDSAHCDIEIIGNIYENPACLLINC